MSEVLTMAEMEARYDREWVLIDEPEVAPNSEVLSGKVVCHSPKRADVHRAMFELESRHFAILYLGALADDLVLVL